MTRTSDQQVAGDGDAGTGRGSSRPRVVIVGAGFAGLGCARALAGTDVDVTLIDRNNYHQFLPLLYQVATAQIASDDVGTPLRNLFRGDDNVDVKQAEVVHVDAGTRTVTTADGATYTGDYLVLATGSRPNFYRTPGADKHTGQARARSGGRRGPPLQIPLHLRKVLELSTPRVAPLHLLAVKARLVGLLEADKIGRCIDT